jgi:hypothetical protein
MEMTNEKDCEEGRKQLYNSLMKKEKQSKSELEGIKRINRIDNCWNDEGISVIICFNFESESINGEV